MAASKKMLFLALLFLTKLSFSQITNMDSTEIFKIVNSAELQKSCKNIPSQIRKFIEEKTGRTFKLTNLNGKRNFTDLDRPRRYCNYQSYSESYFLLSYISVGYTTNTHVLIFRLENKDIKGYVNIITADHYSLKELKNLMTDKSFIIIRSEAL